MGKLTRRAALTRLALGSAGATLFSRNGFPVQDATAPPATSTARLAARSAAAGLSGLEDLANRIRTAPRDAIFDVGARAMQRGADTRTILGAAFLAGVQDIRPHGVGGKFHAVLMVESAYQLIAVSSPRDSQIAALWTLWDFKRCQERDVNEEGDWVLPPRPKSAFKAESQARRELTAALDNWDVARADRALVGLLAFHDDPAPVFEVLRPYGMRCYADLGHKAIYCAHAERTLARVGARYAEPVLRSLILGLLYTDDAGPQTAAFASALSVQAEMPETWGKGKEDPAESATLLRALRDTTPAESQKVVVEAFRSGLGPATIWDGLRLVAAEVFHRRPEAAARRHGPVHPVTELNALGYIAKTTRDETTRRLAILQVAGWLAHLRDDLASIFGDLRDLQLEALGTELEGKAASLEDAFRDPSPDIARVRIDQNDDGTKEYLGQLRHYLYERAFQDHQYKFVAVLHEEAAQIHPRWRSRFLAPAVTYVPTAVDPTTKMRKQSLAALQRAGA